MGIFPTIALEGDSHSPTNRVHPENGPGEADAYWSDSGTEVQRGPLPESHILWRLSEGGLQPVHK